MFAGNSSFRRPFTRTFTALFFSAATLLLLSECKKKKTEDEDVFKKSGIMTNLADNYIIPGYSAQQAAVNNLHDSWTDFTVDMSPANFEQLRTDWKAAAQNFQKVKVFEMGPAMTVNYSLSQGVFPADTSQIDDNIIAGFYDLNSMENRASIGFDAIEYLLYRENAYSLLVSSAAARNYLTALVTRIKSETDQVVSGWATYRNTFIEGTGTASTDAFAMLVNNFSRDLELAKSAKIAYPLGLNTLGVKKPAYLEARRSGFGKELLQANLRGLRNIFYGNSFTTEQSGQGFDDYLNALEYGELSNTIGTKLTALSTSPDSWGGTMEMLLNTQETILENYYNEIYSAVPYIKTDMSSAFSVLITYQDNDGD